jgi:hypothetical protein
LVSVLRVLTAERGDDVAAVVVAVAQDAGVVGEEVVGSGVRELREGWSGAGVIDEVFADLGILTVALIAKGHLEEGEAALRGENFGFHREMRELQAAGVVDAEVGHERRGGGAEGDMDDPHAVPHLAGRGGGVASFGEVSREVEEHEAAPRIAAIVAMSGRAHGGRQEDIFIFVSDILLFIFILALRILVFIRQRLLLVQSSSSISGQRNCLRLRAITFAWYRYYCFFVDSVLLGIDQFM